MCCGVFVSHSSTQQLCRTRILVCCFSCLDIGASIRHKTGFVFEFRQCDVLAWNDASLDPPLRRTASKDCSRSDKVSPDRLRLLQQRKPRARHCPATSWRSRSRPKAGQFSEHGCFFDLQRAGTIRGLHQGKKARCHVSSCARKLS